MRDGFAVPITCGLWHDSYICAQLSWRSISICEKCVKKKLQGLRLDLGMALLVRIRSGNEIKAYFIGDSDLW